MPSRNETVYRVYQLSSHRTLGFFTGEECWVLTFCSLKFNVEEDDIALERLIVRRVNREEVLCFQEVVGQIRVHSDRIKELEEEAKHAGLEQDLVELLIDVEPLPRPPEPPDPPEGPLRAPKLVKIFEQ